MSYIGNTPTIESTEDRQVYNVADVTRKVYGIAYNDDNVSVFWKTILLCLVCEELFFHPLPYHLRILNDLAK